MITENVMLRSDLKKQLQHLSIDVDKYISIMLIEGAQYILDNDVNVSKVSVDDTCIQFTMKIEEELKNRIKVFCLDKEIKIKDFWNESAYIVLQKKGVFE